MSSYATFTPVTSTCAVTDKRSEIHSVQLVWRAWSLCLPARWLRSRYCKSWSLKRENILGECPWPWQHMFKWNFSCQNMRKIIRKNWIVMPRSMRGDFFTKIMMDSRAWIKTERGHVRQCGGLVKTIIKKLETSGMLWTEDDATKRNLSSPFYFQINSGKGSQWTCVNEHQNYLVMSEYYSRFITISRH